MTPEAAKVMVHTQVSTLLDKCERLGNVQSEVSKFGKWDANQAVSQATADVRDKAYSEYGADTVAITNVDHFMSSVNVQAVAFRCDLRRLPTQQRL